MAARARVLEAHRAPDRVPIRVRAGERVTLGERDGDWPDFVWTALASGLGGWIPSFLFDADSGQANALEDYDTKELDAEPGEELALHRELAGWWWADNARGDSGWIPARKLEHL